MLYKNKKTGAIINVQCEIAGDWEPVVKKEEVKEPKEAKGKKKKG